MIFDRFKDSYDLLKDEFVLNSLTSAYQSDMLVDTLDVMSKAVGKLKSGEIDKSYFETVVSMYDGQNEVEVDQFLNFGN